MTTTKKEQVVLVMYRYNPQLGNYCTLRISDVIKVTKTSIKVDYYGTEKVFNFCGMEKKPAKCVYGSAFYRIYTLDRAKDLFDGEKFDGYKISTGKNIFETL